MGCGLDIICQDGLGVQMAVVLPRKMLFSPQKVVFGGFADVVGRVFFSPEL